MIVEACEVRGDVAYRGLVKLHAADIVQCATFRRTGRRTPTQVHRVRMDLAKLSTPHPLDATIELILARADQLDLEAQA